MPNLPAYDYYQTPSHLTLGVYVKGYGVEGVKENVEVKFSEKSIRVALPALPSGAETRELNFEPLFDGIDSAESTYRVLGTKIELKLAKLSPTNWSTLLREADSPLAETQTTHSPAQGSSSSSKPTTSTSSSGPGPAPTPASAAASGSGARKNMKKNWDRVVDEELEEKDQEGNKDPNAGGDAALQSFFSQVYANADEDTKRAMIKSFTESGGTSLSTDWSNIGKETTPIRPPEGMEARKYA